VTVGPQLRLSAELYDVRLRRRLHAVEARGSLADPGPAVDSLAVGLARFRVQHQSSGGARLANEFLPASPQALRAYLAAEQLVRAGEIPRAVDSLLRVIGLDSSFGPAYHRLYILNQFTGAVGAARGWSNERIIALGLRFQERLSPRQRDMLLLADAMYQGQRTEALRRAEALGRTYPDDAEAAYMHGEGYYHFGLNLGEPPQRGLDAFERGIRLDPDVFENYTHAIELSSQTGDTARAWTLIREARRRFPQDPIFLAEELAYRVSRPGADLAALLGEYAEALRSAPGLGVLVPLRQLAHQPARALAVTDSLSTLMMVGMPRSERSGTLARRSELRVAQGRYRDAWADLEEALSLDPENRRVQALMVGFALRTGTRAAEAQDILQRLGGGPSPDVPLARAWWAGAHGDSTALGVVSAFVRSGLSDHPAYAEALAAGYRGLVALHRGDSARARELLASGVAVKPYEIARFCSDYVCPNGAFSVLLARLELAAGQPDAAWGRTFDAYPALVGGSWIAEAEELRGMIAERRGDAAAARRAYQSFIAIWSRADPELHPRMERARAVLARL
jgi:tetratricopeptide (TPR) repeat protein